ncbi:MAG: type 2 lanthipeptide synthetase LanM family protein [Acidobacteriota bacterium]|nr:type 2 lanthipeptide synthetase LanM family protein [Acidobacteriota bacterium]
MTSSDSNPAPDSAASPWPAATPLRHRLQQLRELLPNSWRERSDNRLGERRVELWRRQPPFDRDDVFERRLVTDGLQADSFRDLLGLPAEALSELLPEPEWADALETAFAHPSPPPPGCSWAALLESHPSAEARSLLGWLEPLVNPALRSLHRLSLDLAESSAARSGDPVPWDPETVVPLLAGALPGRLAPKVQRTLILELNIARMEGRLEGETPGERFQSFVHHLQEPAYGLALLAEYPSLARLLSVLVEQWREASEELLTRLAADWPALRERWAAAPESGETENGEPRLESVDTGAGDPHRGGRSVALLSFRDGFRLVYKPRSTAVDQRFAELLEWLAQRGLEPALEAVDTLDRGSHGWSAFVTPGPCRTPAEARRFFQRQGSFLALLHALEATDFHYQNLIADGEHPRLVDLEALLHPRQRQVEAGTPMALMTDSVLRVGLLPQRLWQRHDAGEGEEAGGSGGGSGASGPDTKAPDAKNPDARAPDISGLDVSGLSSQAGQHDPHAAPVAEGLGTDQARVVRRRNVITAGHHRARLGEDELSPVTYREDLLDGFSRTYRLLLEHRAELLADDGPLAAFAEVELRAILRPTRVYALIQGESYHPGALGEASIRDRLFDRLWLEAVERPDLDAVIPAEQEALHRGDIPFFSTRPDSRDLAGEGHVFEDHFQTSGLDAARRKIEGLSEADLERQQWFIEMSLSTVTEGVEEIARAAPSEVGDDAGLPDGPPAQEELMATVEQLAERIRRLALRSQDTLGSNGGDGATWLGVRTGADNSLFLAELSADLQHGLAGIALFLAQLGSLRDDAELHDLARRAWRSAREQIQEGVESADGTAEPPREPMPDPMPRIGGFLGWGSLIYTAVRLASLWPEDEDPLLEFAEGLVPEILRRLLRDRDRDLLGGAAGAVVALLRLYERQLQRQQPTATLEAAIACAEKLLADAQPQHPSSGGVGWPGVAGDQPITGFSHGTAGIAWALLQLARVLRQEPGEHEALIARLEETAAQALAFERRAFRAGEDGTGSATGRWLDLRFYDLDGNVRPGQDPPPLFPAWCHGGAGIGLSRLAFLAASEQDGSAFASPEEQGRLVEEIEEAAAAIAATGFGQNQGLCHGDLGNLEILRRLATALEDDELLQRHDRLAAAILRQGTTHGWRCGTALGVETPSLMNGLAGIGYGLLRLAYPQRVPSVLTLEV